MNRTELEAYIVETYHTDADCPWVKYPSHKVFRHSGSRKWFALVMEVPKVKLGLSGSEALDVVNLKCDPVMTGSLRREPGFFPAYHMNKESWITVSLDGSVPDDKIKLLLDMSFGLTSSPPKKRGV